MPADAEVSAKVEKFFTSYPLKTYEKGQLLILADKNPDKIIYLVGGQVREYDVSGKGEEIVINVFKPPAFFPMSWAIAQSPNRYFFQAATKVEAREAPPAEVLDFMKQNQDVILDLLARLYRGIDGLQ